MDQAVVIRPQFAPGRRIIAVSDVHGNLDFFRGLMDQVGLNPSDILVLVGDLLEKGPDSLTTLRFIMELAASTPPICPSTRRAPSVSWRRSWFFRTGVTFQGCGPLCGSPIRRSAPGCGGCPPSWRRSIFFLSTAAFHPWSAWRR